MEQLHDRQVSKSSGKRIEPFMQGEGKGVNLVQRRVCSDLEQISHQWPRTTRPHRAQCRKR